MPDDICSECGAKLPSEAWYECHLLHSDLDYKMAWDFTGGRFQLMLIEDEDGEWSIETRNRGIMTFRGKDAMRDSAMVHTILEGWLDLQADKGPANPKHRP